MKKSEKKRKRKEKIRQKENTPHDSKVCIEKIHISAINCNKNCKFYCVTLK